MRRNRCSLQAVRQALAELHASSILAVPLIDGEETVGVLVLMHNRPRVWQPADMVVLKTLAEQMVIALNNAGLRRLVKNLSVTDEKSGLLKRASYIDLLLAESKRAMQNASPLSVLLMQFGKSAALIKEYGEAEVQAMMERSGSCSPPISARTIWRSATTLRPSRFFWARRRRKKRCWRSRSCARLLRTCGCREKMAREGQPLRFSAGLAEAVIRQEYDPVDIVTEMINRAEHALVKRWRRGRGKLWRWRPALAAGAVA